MKLLRLPGLTDIHVHLRDPGETYKEDFYTGTYAALAGGVTTVFDMPNNIEPVFTEAKLNEKLKIAKGKSVCDWGLYFGSIGENINEFEKVIDKVIGLKVYLSLTTGKYVVNDPEKVEKIVKSWPKAKIIVFHAVENNIDLVIKLAEKFNNKIHITHVTNKKDLEKIIDAKKNKLNLTCDVTPHHLFLTERDLFTVKPPLSTKKDQEYLWQNLSWVDCIASDHAPHTLDEKNSSDSPFGVPGLETMLPLLITAVKENRLSFDDIVRLTSKNPERIFGFYQKDSIIEVDIEQEYIIANTNLKTKCGWSPYSGRKVFGRISQVVLRGHKVFDDGKILVDPGFGRNVI